MTVCVTASAQERSGFLLKARERSGRVMSWILSYRRLGTSAEQFEGQALLVDVRLNILSRLKRMVEPITFYPLIAGCPNANAICLSTFFSASDTRSPSNL